jgi:hypothetical protein
MSGGMPDPSSSSAVEGTKHPETRESTTDGRVNRKGRTSQIGCDVTATLHDMSRDRRRSLRAKPHSTGCFQGRDSGAQYA